MAETSPAGRALGLPDTIPQENRSQIERKVANSASVLQLPPKQLLGISIRDASWAYFLLLKHYADLWQRFNATLPQGDGRLSVVGIKLDQLALSNYWSFTPDSLTSQFNQYSPALEAFVKIFSQAPPELRSAIRSVSSPYELGHLSLRMLPIDRHPIVALPNNRYIIPNITIFRKSFYHVLDFSLMDAYRNDDLDETYNQVRGASLEVYIENLVSGLLPSCILIPETEYRTSLGARRSPDLCILDLDDATLIVVEAKARRLSPAAAARATDTELDRSYAPSVDALRELPRKIEHLYTKPEFESLKQHLARVPRERVVLVSVVPGTLFFHDELEPLRARLDPLHPLAKLDQPFCFLDLPVFERAVELAHMHRIPLGQLLREHYEDSRAGDPNTGAARLFRSRTRPEPTETFASRFISRPPTSEG